MGKLTKGQQMQIVKTARGNWRVRWIDRSKYLPHQGKRECERRAGA
jgi:hypothetical protein